MTPLALSIAEAAKSVGVSEWTARRLVDAGEWPVVRIGRRQVIPVVGLQRWLDDHTEQEAAS